MGYSSGKLSWVHFCELGPEHARTILLSERPLYGLMLVVMFACHAMKSLVQRWKGGDDCHPLFHCQTIFWVHEVTGSAQIKLTCLGVVMDFGQAWQLEHE